MRLRNPIRSVRTLRELRAQTGAIVLMVLTACFGLGVGAFLVVHERLVWPSWLPVVGQHQFVLNAPVNAVSGLLPGQGQAVTVSGVTVGQISGVSLRHGTPIVSMQIDPQYTNRIYPNATVLLRPKTGLSDMVAELDPGTPSSGPHLQSGATLSAGNTLPVVDFDEILAQLDADTRAELTELVSGAGQALSNGGGEHLGDVFRRLDPLSRDVEMASRLTALRAVELQRLMGNLAKIATTLGDNETALTAFVRGNAGVWHAFADQDQSLQQMIQLLPPALDATNGALAKATALGHALSTLGELQSSARTLGPSLADLRPFFRDTAPVFRDQLRPFAVKAQPTARLLSPGTSRFARSTPGLTTLARVLDAIVNELAYKPRRGQSYLFYVPWDNHNTNSLLSSQDGVGPLRSGMLLFTCGTLELMQNFITNPAQNPTLATLIQLLSRSDFSTNCKVDANGNAVPK
jgi:phospholipid/cholesterol/gamma-HCH transport system substrate-binding protein